MYVRMHTVHAVRVTPSDASLAASFRLAREQFALYTIPGVFGLLIAFSTILEGSVTEMKPTAPVPVDIVISLKA